MRAKDIMTSPVTTVTGDTPLKNAAEILVTREISALPVVDGRGKLIGILSEADIVPLELTPDPRAQMIPVPARAVAHIVEEAMTRDVVALPEDAGISWIATLLLEKHIKRIPIVSGEFVVGIVSRRDLLRVLIRSDAQIHSDLQTLLDGETAGIGAYRVEVSNGAVTLAGPRDDISRKSAALLARTIPGVVEVTFTDVGCGAERQNAVIHDRSRDVQGGAPMTISGGSSVQVRHMGDTEFSVEMRGHKIVVDLPLEAGGGDAGPSPTQLFVASLVAGVAFFGRSFLHARGLPDRVDVNAHWWIELTPTRVERVEISVQAPGLPASTVDTFRRAIERCTVHNTLIDPPKVLLGVNGRRAWGSSRSTKSELCRPPGT